MLGNFFAFAWQATSSLSEEVQKQITQYDDGDFVFHPKEDNLKYDEKEYVRYYNNIVTAFTYDDLSSGEMKELADSINGVVVGDISGAIDYLQIMVEASGYETIRSYSDQLAKSEKVMFSGYDFPLPLSEFTDNNPWSNDGRTIPDKGKQDDPNGDDQWAEMIEAYTAWEYSDHAQPISIGVIDSGINLGHEDFGNNIIMFDNYPQNPKAGHGTWVLGPIAAENNHVGIRGVADQAEVYCFDCSVSQGAMGGIIDNKMTATEFIAISKTMILTKSVSVLNLSLGLVYYDEPYFNQHPELQTDYGTYQNYCREHMKDVERTSELCMKTVCSLIDHGKEKFIYVEGAGNGWNNDCNAGRGIEAYYSGLFDAIDQDRFQSFKNKNPSVSIDYQELCQHIIRVGASSHVSVPSSANYWMSNFSNYGNNVDLCAPGENVLTTVNEPTFRYGILMGTSLSTPIVTGAAALVWSLNPDYTAGEVKDLLISSSTRKVIPVGNGAATDQPQEYPLLNVGAAARKAFEDYRLHHYLEVSGSVTDQNDQALPDVTVTLKAGNAEYHSQTDGLGKYFFDIEKQGVEYTLEFSKEGYLTISEDFNNDTDRKVTLDEKMFPQDETRNYAGVISGKVLSADNRPVKNAKVEVYVSDDHTSIRFGEDECYTADDGSFAIPMPEGTYLLVITCDGYDPVNVKDVTVEKNKTTRADDIRLKKNNSKMSIPSDALQYRGHSYYVFSDIAYTWDEVKAYCESLGGYLAVINDEAENTALYEYIKSVGYKSAYFGYSDSEAEGVWKWVGNDDSDYENWASGEPNNQRGTENYGMLYRGFTDGKWNDGGFYGKSDDTTAFICEWDSTGNTGDSNYETLLIQALLDNESEWNQKKDGLSIVDAYFFDVDFDDYLEFLVKYGDDAKKIYQTGVYYYDGGLQKYQSPIHDGRTRWEVFLDTKSQKYNLRGKDDSGSTDKDGETYYFDIDVNKKSSKSTLYAYESWNYDALSYQMTRTYYRYNNVIISSLGEVSDKKVRISKDEYDKIMIDKSEGLEPVYVTSDSLSITDYNGYTDSKKKNALKNAFESFRYYGRSDQLQYYQGKHYYTTDHIVNTAHIRYDFSSARPSYIALPVLNANASVDGSELKIFKLSFDNFAIIRDKIYFTCEYPPYDVGTTANLYVCNMDGSDVKLICEYVHYNFAYDENNIYFQTENVDSRNFGQLQDKKIYNLASGKILASTHNMDLEFNSKFSPFRQYPQEPAYYDGAMYYREAIHDFKKAEQAGANVWFHCVDADGSDTVIGKYWAQQM